MGLGRILWCFVPLALSFALIYYLEDRVNHWFAPFTNPSASPSPGATASSDPGKVGSAQVYRGPHRKRFKVLIDPGHGGRAERRSPTTGDNWDPVAGEFLAPYMGGGSRIFNKLAYTEHEFVLALGKRIKLILDKSRDESSWPAFEAQLRQYVDVSKTVIPRVYVDCVLSRDHSFLDHPDAANPNVNKYFRLFDGPDSFPVTARTQLAPGRLSILASQGADLVLDLHVNDSSVPSLRGPTALFVPPFQYFEDLRLLALNVKPWKDIHESAYYEHFTTTHVGKSRKDDIIQAAQRYFLDSGLSKGERHSPPRYDRIQWAYRDPAPVSRTDLNARPTGPYWEREQSQYESFRRAGGMEDIGGDNLYAGQELIRYMRYALWKDYRQHAPGGVAAVAPEQYLGRHLPPSGSDWLIPLYCNSVVAYVEMAYLSNEADRAILDAKLDVVAQGLAVGIYSLLAGMKVKEMQGLPSPRGKRIDWERYEIPGGKRYFEMARMR